MKALFLLVLLVPAALAANSTTSLDNTASRMTLQLQAGVKVPSTSFVPAEGWTLSELTFGGNRKLRSTSSAWFFVPFTARSSTSQKVKTFELFYTNRGSNVYFTFIEFRSNGQFLGFYDLTGDDLTYTGSGEQDIGTYNINNNKAKFVLNDVVLPNGPLVVRVEVLCLDGNDASRTVELLYAKMKM